MKYKQWNALKGEQNNQQFRAGNFSSFSRLSLQSRPQMVWFSYEQQPISVAAHEGLGSICKLTLK